MIFRLIINISFRIIHLVTDDKLMLLQFFKETQHHVLYENTSLSPLGAWLFHCAADWVYVELHRDRIPNCLLPKQVPATYTEESPLTALRIGFMMHNLAVLIQSMRGPWYAQHTNQLIIILFWLYYFANAVSNGEMFSCFWCSYRSDEEFPFQCSIMFRLTSLLRCS